MQTLARFKAKYAVSNRMLTYFLDVDLDTAIAWVENDTAPDEVTELIEKVSALIERFIQENEALAGEGPYIQTLNHQLEIAQDEIFRKQTEITKLKERVDSFKRIGFFGRLKFLVNPKDVS